MAKQVVIGNVYSATVGNEVFPVRIDAERENRPGSYRATNMITKVPMRVNASELRGTGVPEAEWKPSTGDAPVAPEAAPQAPAAKGKKPAAKPAAKAPAKKAEKPAAKAKAPKTPKEPKAPAGPRHSLVNAAILVLSKSSKPMNTRDIVVTAKDRGLFTPGEGKTPESTLYSAFLTDKKGRFEKADRGLWKLTKAGEAEVDGIKKAFAAFAKA